METQSVLELELAELETSVDTLIELLRLNNVIDYDEMKLIISKDIVRLNQVDPAHVMMLYSENLTDMITVKKFEKQRIIQAGGVEARGTTYLIAIFDEPKEWMKFLRVYKKKNGNKNIKIQLTTRFITLGSPKLQRKMRIVYDSNYYVPKVPTLKLQTRFRMNLQDIHDYLKLCKYTDYIAFLFTDNLVEIKSDVGEDGYLNVILHPDEISDSADSKSLYPLDYICNMINAIKKEDAWVSFNTDYPIKVEFTPFDNGIVFTYLLAPRIESQ